MARFGAYEILHELKTGGMGQVLLGRRRGPGAFEQLVAIKTIRPEYAQTEAVRAMFLDEAAILARINHPGIATVHDFGEEAGSLYMVMEYVAGISFRALTDHVMAPGVAARAIAEACRGLHAAHDARDNTGTLLGLVHRDISPDNLMLGYDGHVKVIDFGIALVKNRQSPVTEFGTVKGKPPYMSPEQVMNEPLDRRSDVFSLGIVFHELLTGKPVFDGDSIYAVAYAVQNQPLRPPSQVLGAPLPAGLDAAVMSALDRDLAGRVPTAAALAERLELVISTAGDESLEAWAARELAEPRDAHRRWITSVTAAHDAGGSKAPADAPLPRPPGSQTPGESSAFGPAMIDTHGNPAAASARVPAALADPRYGTSDVVVDQARARAPRSSKLPLLLGLALLLGVGGAVVVLTRSPTAVPDGTASPEAGVPPREADVPITDTLVVTADVVDAGVADAGVADAAVIAGDAGRRTPRDAGQPPPPRDATTVAAVPVDAAAPKGAGGLIVKPFDSSSYLEVYVDGKMFGKTPLLRAKPIAAGRHVVTLVSPTTAEVVYRTTIEVEDTRTVTVQQPAP